MIAGKTLLDYTNLLPPFDYQKNDKIMCYWQYDNKCDNMAIL